MQSLSPRARLRCAALMALTGGAVGQTMSVWGGDLARFLPPVLAMSCAGAVGAGLAGLVLADAFGRRGPVGAALSCLGWPIATALGAVFGAGAVFAATGGYGAPDLARAIADGAPLGLVAVADGIANSPVVAATWSVCGLAMHQGARAERGGPI